MVKNLRDICLDLIYRNFESIFHIGAGLHVGNNWRSPKNLPLFARHELLNRMIDHDLLTPELLPRLTYHLISHALQRLDVYGSCQLDDALLTHIGIACHHLKFVRLSRCMKITDAGLSELLANQSNLEHLELRWLLIGGECLRNARSVLNLHTLILKGCSNVVSPNVCKLISNNRRICRLNLFGLRKINDDALEEITNALGSNLIELDLSECLLLTERTLEALSDNCPNLSALSMIECMNILDVGFARLFASCPKLTRLDMSFCVRWQNALSHDVVSILPDLLQSLTFNGIRVTCSDDAIRKALIQLQNLTALRLNGFGSMSDSLLHALLADLGARLELLDVSGNFDKLTDDGLTAVAKYCTRLTSFGCALLNHVDGRSLLPLFSDRGRAGRIQRLIFTVCSRLDYALLTTIAENCPSLDEIDLSGVCSVDDYVICCLADNCNVNLRTVYAKAPIKITDESVCRLAFKCPSLRCLSLSGNRNITDRSILALAERCYYFQELYLSGCMMVSEASVRYLKDQCRFRVSVYHVAPNPSLTSVILAKNLDTGQFVRIGT